MQQAARERKSPHPFDFTLASIRGSLKKLLMRLSKPKLIRQCRIPDSTASSPCTNLEAYNLEQPILDLVHHSPVLEISCRGFAKINAFEGPTRNAAPSYCALTRGFLNLNITSRGFVNHKYFQPDASCFRSTKGFVNPTSSIFKKRICAS